MALEEQDARNRRTRKIILIVGSIVLLAMVYGSGMRSQVRKIQAINEQRKLAEQNYRVAQRDLRLRLAVAQQLEARRRLELAMGELDRRNFGVAHDHIRTAADLLNAAQKANTNTPDLSALAAQLEAINLVSATDVAAARLPLVDAAHKMDAALSPFIPRFLDASVKADAAHPIKAPTMNDVPLPPGNDVTRTE
jgi:hypothetical protein